MRWLINPDLFHPYNIVIIGGCLYLFLALTMLVQQGIPTLNTGTLKVV